MNFDQELSKTVETKKLRGSIQITTDFFGMAWFLYFVTPIIELDGHSIKRDWGTNSFDLDEGEYVVKIFFPYFFMTQCGANQVKVKIESGKTTKLSYYMPPWMFSKGRMKILN